MVAGFGRGGSGRAMYRGREPGRAMMGGEEGGRDITRCDTGVHDVCVYKVSLMAALFGSQAFRVTASGGDPRLPFSACDLSKPCSICKSRYSQNPVTAGGYVSSPPTIKPSCPPPHRPPLYQLAPPPSSRHVAASLAHRTCLPPQHQRALPRASADQPSAGNAPVLALVLQNQPTSALCA